MTIAVLTFDSFFDALPRWFGKPVLRRIRPAVAMPLVATRANQASSTAPFHSKSRLRRPLRVVRIVEPGEAAAGAGRMVISGRFADVCAELDRLAERESQGR